MATHAINDLAAHAFELVNKELSSTLDAARAELEGYVDGRAGPDALLKTAEHLHAAWGALKIVAIHGAHRGVYGWRRIHASCGSPTACGSRAAGAAADASGRHRGGPAASAAASRSRSRACALRRPVESGQFVSPAFATVAG